MKKKLLSTALSLLLACQLLAPGLAQASLGAAKLKEPSPTSPGTNNPPVVTPSPEQDPAPAPDQLSTADLIRYLRAQKAQGSSQTPSNPSPTPTTPANPPNNPANPPVSGGSVLSSEAVKMVSLVNEERTKRGLKPLAVHAKLAEVAQLKSQDMLNHNYFSHTSPTYGSFAAMVYNAGIGFRSVGENLAQARNATHAHALLMASEGHRNNILNPNFTHTGIGIVQGPYGVYVTQLFIMQ